MSNSHNSNLSVRIMSVFCTILRFSVIMSLWKYLNWNMRSLVTNWVQCLHTCVYLCMRLSRSRCSLMTGWQYFHSVGGSVLPWQDVHFHRSVAMVIADESLSFGSWSYSESGTMRRLKIEEWERRVGVKRKQAGLLLHAAFDCKVFGVDAAENRTWENTQKSWCC